MRGEARAALGDVFFVDEIHMATKDTTLLMGLLRHLFGADGAGGKRMLVDAPKLIFASATFDSADIVTFFGELPKVTLEAVHHPIEMHYRGSLALAPKIDAVIGKVVLDELARWKAAGPLGRERCAMLIFRPGQQEVEKTADTLYQLLPATEPFVIYNAYSYMSPEEIDMIFTPCDDRLKIVVATNIAESSITIEDVGVVVRRRRPRSDAAR